MARYAVEVEWMRDALAERIGVETEWEHYCQTLSLPDSLVLAWLHLEIQRWLRQKNVHVLMVSDGIQLVPPGDVRPPSMQPWSTDFEVDFIRAAHAALCGDGE